MIIYVVEHISFFSQMLTLRLHKHRNEKAILALGGPLRYQDIEYTRANLVSTELFDYVIYCDNVLLSEDDRVNYKDVLHKKHHDSLTRNGLSIDDITLAYCGWHSCFSFTLYMCAMGVPHVLVELKPNSGPVQFSPIEMNIWINIPSMHGKISQVSVDVMKKYLPLSIDGLFMHEVRAKGILIFPETNLPDNSLLERFDFFGNFEKIADEDKQNVLQCFNVDIENFVNNRVSLVLGSGLGTMNIAALTFKYVLSDYMYDSPAKSP